MSRVLTLARQIGGGPITDKSTETIYQDGLIASEFLLAAVLVEGTGIAVDAFIRFSHGRVNSRSILDAIKVPLSKLDIPTVPGGTWDEFVLQSSNASRDKDPDSNNVRIFGLWGQLFCVIRPFLYLLDFFNSRVTTCGSFVCVH